jgi:hypothetical protein
MFMLGKAIRIRRDPMSHKSKRAFPLLLVMGLLLFGAARAAGQTGEQTKDVSVSVLFGADSVLVGAFNHEEVIRTGLGSRTQRLFAHSANKVYRRPISVGLEVVYTYGPGAEVITRVTFASARSKGPLEFSESIILPSTRTTSVASFSDYRAWTFEGGHRWGGRDGKRVSPYLGALLGVAVVEPISTDARFVSFAGPGSAFYKRTVTPTASVSVGVMFRATRAAAIGVESGLRYQDKLNPDPTNLRTGWITEETFSGWRLSVPVTGVLRFDF